MQMIVNATNIRARHRTPVVSLSNRPAKTQLFGSCHRHWFDLTVWELYSYFAILIYIAVNPITSIEAYWGLDHGVHEYITLAITCNWFQDISRNFSIRNGITGEFGRVF
jgi:hypothetical protein